MLNRQPGLHRRSVWVLMFESLSLEFVHESVREDPTAVSDVVGERRSDAVDHGLAVDEANVTAKKAYTTFDNLDMSSAFFEQYLIQDARSGVTTADVLGGEEAWRHFQQLLKQRDCAMVNVVLSKADEQAEVDSDPALKGFESSAVTIHISLKSQSEQGESLPEHLTDDSRILDADLLWIDVRNGSLKQDPAWLALISGKIMELRRRIVGDPAEQPILIVSSLRGSSRTVALPFIGGCEESLIHVPLWIDDGNGHARRLQKLAGSFDLLPTLVDYLIGEPEGERSRVPTDAPVSGDKDTESKDTANLTVGPRSLRPMLRDFDIEGDRLLRLVGDAWSALRSQQYLLVSAEMQDQNSEAMDSGLDRRRLYLKPDDVWNVHDSIVTYEAVANEMDTVWQQSGV